MTFPYFSTAQMKFENCAQKHGMTHRQHFLFPTIKSQMVVASHTQLHKKLNLDKSHQDQILLTKMLTKHQNQKEIQPYHAQSLQLMGLSLQLNASYLTRFCRQRQKRAFRALRPLATKSMTCKFTFQLHKVLGENQPGLSHNWHQSSLFS